MADENEPPGALPGALEDEIVQAPATPERSFAPLSQDDITAPAKTQAPATGPQRRPPPRGMPSARVDPDMVKEFEQEIDTKVTTGRKRMRWFANHLILFVAVITAAIPLRLTIYAEFHDAFFLVPLGTWVGLLAFHANYALRPMLKRSEKESQIKAIIPTTETGESAGDASNRE
ncbi:MAG: hypothetical protein IH994_12990 [Proteobacteria bacterium]|nr:hypothetical protein [Pseudomonadota bacterium]